METPSKDAIIRQFLFEDGPIKLDASFKLDHTYLDCLQRFINCIDRAKAVMEAQIAMVLQAQKVKEPLQLTKPLTVQDILNDRYQEHG